MASELAPQPATQPTTQPAPLDRPGTDRAPRRWLITGGVQAIALAFVAGMVYPNARLLVLCGLGFIPAAWAIWRGLSLTAARVPLPMADMPMGLPADQAALVEKVLLLETHIEHAPIALFLVDDQRVVPQNANARRLTAPGRASNASSLYSALQALPAGYRRVIHFDTEQGVERALASVSGIAVQGKGQRMVALMPVESELEEAALQAWRELVHVLTHEIMNSLTPVASLSLTAHDMLDDLRAELPADAAADLSTALAAISRRAHSLADFVASYRSLSSITPAQPERVRLEDLFRRVEALVGAAWRARGGKAVFEVEPGSLEVMLDPGQFEQALINLLKNAGEATADVAAPQVNVSARLGRGGRLRIDVSDNGPGVPDELVNQIFTPFFSTKEKGSGIGLAMVRQLIHANGGTVRYAKPLKAGARFAITF